MIPAASRGATLSFARPSLTPRWLHWTPALSPCLAPLYPELPLGVTASTRGPLPACPVGSLSSVPAHETRHAFCRGWAPHRPFQGRRPHAVAPAGTRPLSCALPLRVYRLSAPFLLAPFLAACHVHLPSPQRCLASHRRLYSTRSLQFGSAVRPKRLQPCLAFWCDASARPAAGMEVAAAGALFMHGSFERIQAHIR